MQGSMLWLLLTAACAAAMVSGSQPSLSNGRKLRQGGSAETVRPCKPLFVPVLLHCAPLYELQEPCSAVLQVCFPFTFHLSQ